VTGGATAGSSRAFRLDPHTLPARSSALGGRSVGPAFTIDSDRAVVRRSAVNGSELTTTVPLSAYAGVAVRVEANDAAGGVCVFVELLHTDPSLTLPLLVADDADDAAADWRTWGRTLGLPLLVIAPDGTVIESSQTLGGVAIRPIKPRRRYSFFAARRPRFLTRRKTGRLERMVRLAGREIIARA